MGLYRAARHGPAPVFGSGRSSRNSRIFLHLLLPPPSRGAEGILVRRAGGPDLSSIFQGRPGAPPPRSEGLYRAPQRGPRSEPEPGEYCWNRIPAPPLPLRPAPLAGRRVDPRKKGPPVRARDAGRTPLGWPSGQDPLVCGPGELFGDSRILCLDRWSGVRHLTTRHTVLPNARKTGKTRYRIWRQMYSQCAEVRQLLQEDPAGVAPKFPSEALTLLTAAVAALATPPPPDHTHRNHQCRR